MPLLRHASVALNCSLVAGRLAQVFQHGQNPRREDRDTFPFHIVLQLADAYSQADLAVWLTEATRLEADELPEIEPVTTPPVTADNTDIKEHISDMVEGMRAELAMQVVELRSAMERKVDEIRFDAIQKLAREINNDEAVKVIEEFETEMRDKLARKETELTEMQRDLNLLHSQLADLTEQGQEFGGADVYRPADAYPTLEATVALFRDISEDSPVHVHDKALKSARCSASTRRREVLQFLLTLRELAQATYSREGPGMQLKQWFAARGYEYAWGDSQSTSTRFGEERQLTIDGTIHQMQDHVTLFENTPNCVSVYFIRHDDEQELVVGYVGPHMRTATR